MAFDLKNFIVTNLVEGVKNGTFTKEYANIAAVNYLAKGILTEEHVISVDVRIEEWKAEQAVVPEPPVEEFIEDPIPVEPTVEEEVVEETPAEEVIEETP